MEFNKLKSNRKAKELSLLMKEKTQKVFCTIITNDNGTLGLARVFLVFKIASQEGVIFEELNKESKCQEFNYRDNYFDYNTDICKEYYEYYLNLINYIHNRIMTHLHKLVKVNQCKELPLVHMHFDRREF